MQLCLSQPQNVLSPPPPSPLSLSLTLRSANKNVFVQINRRGCSSTFQCIFYEGHAVCCRCCCSDEGPAPPRCKKRNSPAEKMYLRKSSSQTRGLLQILNRLPSHIIDNRVCVRSLSHSQTAMGNDLYGSRQEGGGKILQRMFNITCVRL